MPICDLRVHRGTCHARSNMLHRAVLSRQADSGAGVAPKASAERLHAGALRFLPLLLYPCPKGLLRTCHKRPQLSPKVCCSLPCRFPSWPLAGRPY
jgi:hypothetical protein